MNQQAMDRLEQGVNSASPMRIVYQDVNGARTIREIVPTGVVVEKMLLFTECAKRRAPRTFRLDRIQHVYPLRVKAARTEMPEDVFEGLF